MAEVDPASLPESIAVKNDEGQVILRVGLLLTLYFDNGGDRTVMKRVADCIAHFRAMVSPNLRWVFLPEAERFQRLTIEAVEEFERWIRAGTVDYGWETSWLGGRNPQEASEYRITALGEDSPLPRLGYLHVLLPLNPREPQFEKFAAAALRFCEILKPYHGYGGIGFAQSAHGVVEDEAQPLVYSLAQRYPGIEVDSPSGHSLYLADGIKGVNWLTVLGPRWVEAMGGVDSLRRSLRDEFVFHPFDGGLMIQAGPRPQAGDVNQRIWPENYAELARLLKPIRVTDLGSFGNNGQNRFTHATSIEWLARFDRDPPF